MVGRSVVLHLSRGKDFLDTREGRSLDNVGRALARVMNCRFAGCHDPASRPSGPTFYVPDETLTADVAAGLGIRSASDLYGGVVPHEFVRTKAITHGLVGDDAARPPGWSPEFTDRVRDVVLPGHTAFTRSDAERAALALLGHGRVRAKRPLAAGGRGQAVIGSMDDLHALLDEMTDRELSACGLVIELDLEGVTTLSVGHVSVGDLTVTYHGRQRLTRDNAGQEVYGGSDLTCVRGDGRGLSGLAAGADVQRAIAQARRYDEAAADLYGVVASRRNYDVAQGVDAAGRWRSGVLEQSWRVGGASGAEAVALEAFARDPKLELISVSSIELYGPRHAPPSGAVVEFAGVDPEAGPMVRYVVIREVLTKVA